MELFLVFGVIIYIDIAKFGVIGGSVFYFVFGFLGFGEYFWIGLFFSN